MLLSLLPKSSRSCRGGIAGFFRLAIGSTCRLIDGISPGMAADPASGNFGVLMPWRCVAENAPEDSHQPSASSGEDWWAPNFRLPGPSGHCSLLPT